jgi:1-acyl-sn-glycerol-3-phosphate acyltransferase
MLRVPLVLVGCVALTALLALVLWIIDVFKLRGKDFASIAYCRLMCALLRVQIRTVGQPAARSVLLVSNHVSWLDILVISAVVPAMFVAKREVARWPLVGFVARTRGTVFVDRERRHQTAEASADIGHRIVQGQPVVLFAEGTSSDGNRVLPFRSALLGAADEALTRAAPGQHLWVQPMALSYTRSQGIPMGRQRRPLVAWYGMLDLTPHLVDFIRYGAVDAVVSFGEPVAMDGTLHRKALVRHLESAVRELNGLALRGRMRDLSSAGEAAVPFFARTRYEGPAGITPAALKQDS